MFEFKTPHGNYTPRSRRPILAISLYRLTRPMRFQNQGGSKTVGEIFYVAHHAQAGILGATKGRPLWGCEYLGTWNAAGECLARRPCGGGVTVEGESWN